MVMWVFGYGSLIWKAGFRYDERLVGFIKGYRRVFYQGSTDHRGTPSYPGRTVTLEPSPLDVCWGVAYKVTGEEEEQMALSYLEVREKQYDEKAYLDFYTDPASLSPAVSGVMVYIASPDKNLNRNYLGPASLEEMAHQIANAEGPSGPNRDYLFQLETALLQFGRFLEEYGILSSNSVTGGVQPFPGQVGSMAQIIQTIVSYDAQIRHEYERDTPWTWWGHSVYA